ncbi:MAG: hypothetical protein HY897_00880 [Deltaproteobacteria bacterium]|nr:hypothetical protein [Deltaproteobacteria bacterium]
MATKVAGFLGFIAVLAAAAMISCNGGGSGEDAGAARVNDTGGIPAGSEGGPCFGNGTCNQDLACASDLCVRLPDAGADTGAAADAVTEQDADEDAGFDAGTPDTGFDAGTEDAGFDAGMPDIGVPDAGFPQTYPRPGKGCKDFGFDPQNPRISDSLKFNPKGILKGRGTYTQDGFNPPDAVSCDDPEDTSYVEYKIPSAECGRVEFDAVGLDNSFTCQKAEEVFAMYDDSWEHPVSQSVLDRYQYNPYKVTLLLHCDEPGGACDPAWGGGWFNAGNDSIGGAVTCRAFASMKPLTLDPGQTQHFVVQWFGDDAGTCLYIEGTGNPAGGYNCVPRASCGEYVSYVQTITIGGTPMGPPATGATFSNVKIWWFQPQ